MEDLFIKETPSTPRITFKISGALDMEGRSLPEDSVSFYTPIFDWAKGYKAENTILNIKLEYLNTSSSKQVLILLKIICENNADNEIEINWYYEEGDLDSLETGEHFAHILKRKFNFIG